MSRQDHERRLPSPAPTDEATAEAATGQGGKAANETGSAGGRFRDLLTYGASRGVSQGLLGARGLVVATLLGPGGFGAWTLFKLALEYAAAADLGALQGLELAVARGDAGSREDRESQRSSGSPARATRARDAGSAARTALGFNLAVYSGLAAAALLASFLVEDRGWTVGLRGFAAAAVAVRCWRYGLVYLRSRSRVRRYSLLEVVNGGLHLGLTALGAWLWGLAGALGAFAGASLLSAALLVPDVPSRPRLDGATLGPLLREGFPLLAALAVSTAMTTADRLVVAAYGGTTMLGHYAFAAAVAGMAASAVWAVRTVVFPDVYGKAETHGSESAVKEHTARTLLPFARLFPPVLGVGAFAIGPMVAFFLPEYREAVPPARLFLFTGVTFGLVSLGSLSVAAAARQRLLPTLGGTALVLNVGLSLAALAVGAGLQGVAASALVSQAAFGGGIIVISAMESGEARPYRLTARSLLPLAYCSASVFLVSTILPGLGLVDSVTSLGLYLVTLVPLAPTLWRSVRVLRSQATDPRLA